MTCVLFALLAGASHAALLRGLFGRLRGPPASAAADELSRVQRFLANMEPPQKLKYGGHPSQFVDLFLPADSPASDNPTVVIVHGGFFKNKWSSANTQTTSLVPFLVERSMAVALVEYRRRDDCLWPGPEDDVCTAIAAVADDERVDASRLTVIGHSAGGQLAIAACERLPGTAALCVSIAPVPDMLAAYPLRLSDEGDAIERYLGCLPDTEEHLARYRNASLPTSLATPTLLVTSDGDVDVPPALVRDYHATCCRGAGDDGAARVHLLDLPDADHYDVVTADAPAWMHIWRRIHGLMHEHAGWAPPPWPADYGVTVERGFLPPADPLTSLLPLPAAVASEAAADGTAALFAAWEAAATALPGELAARNVRARLAALPLAPPPSDFLPHLRVAAGGEERWLERAYLVLSFLAHAAVWGEDPPLTTLPRAVAVPWCAVAEALGRRPVLTYASFNLHNWRRIDAEGPVALDNTCRCNNFLGGLDEEWFSAVHVAIEARSGEAVVSAADAVRLCARTDFSSRPGAASDATRKLEVAAASIEDSIAILERMGERCDPYIYNERVRVFMSGWTADAMPEEGLTYEGVEGVPRTETAARGDGKGGGRGGWRTEAYFGETGAQSSVVPALDAALGVGFSEDELLPYLLAMREYMPPRHAEFIRALERAPSLRDAVVASGDAELQEAYNRCIEGLVHFRKLHFELAYTYVRQWDQRPDEEIKGTGGTPFMPYLKKHRRTTFETLVPTSGGDAQQRGRAE